jgi:hypothetical protein
MFFCGCFHTHILCEFTGNMKVIFFAQTPAPQGVESCTISLGRGGIEAAFHPDWENFNAIGLPPNR